MKRRLKPDAKLREAETVLLEKHIRKLKAENAALKESRDDMRIRVIGVMRNAAKTNEGLEDIAEWMSQDSMK